MQKMTILQMSARLLSGKWREALTGDDERYRIIRGRLCFRHWLGLWLKSEAQVNTTVYCKASNPEGDQ